MLNIKQLKNLKGASGENALYIGSAGLTDTLSSVVDARKNVLATGFVANFDEKKLRAVTANVAKAVAPMSDPASKVAAYQVIAQLLMKAGAKTLIAQKFSDDMLKKGVTISASSLLANTPATVNGVNIAKSGIELPLDSSIKLVNNVRAALSTIFVDQEGNPTTNGDKAINSLMRPIEKAMQKNQVQGVSTALLNLVMQTDTLATKIEQHVRDCGMTPDLMNNRTMAPTIVNTKRM